MKEHVSELLDGELEDAEAARRIAAMKDDAELRSAWDTYLLIGDAMRGHLGPDLTAGVSRRLAAEPVILAPRPAARPAPRKWALSAAAGVAAVALVAWMARPMFMAEPQVAQLPAPAPVAQAEFPPPSPAAGPAAAPAQGSAADVDNYLLAHQRYSGTSAMQGVAPYVRTVSHDPGAKR